MKSSWADVFPFLLFFLRFFALLSHRSFVAPHVVYQADLLLTSLLPSLHLMFPLCAICHQALPRTSLPGLSPHSQNAQFLFLKQNEHHQKLSHTHTTINTWVTIYSVCTLLINTFNSINLFISGLFPCVNLNGLLGFFFHVGGGAQCKKVKKH